MKKTIIFLTIFMILNTTASVFAVDFWEESGAVVNVTVSKTDFDLIMSDALSKRTYPANVNINTRRYSNVGFRAKGNTTLVNNVKTGADKIPFKLDFPAFVKTQMFDDISIINFNNEYLDPAFAREFIAYEIFRRMGVPVPKYNYCTLYINNACYGFYFAVENIGDGYLLRHFGNADGELYKPNGKGSDLVYRGDDKDLFKAFSAKTKAANKKTAVINMVRVLNTANTKEALEGVLDVDEVLRYLAVNAALVNYDSYLAGNSHNYYLYEQNGIFTILPWDLNMAFGGKPMRIYNKVPLTDLYIDEPVDGGYYTKPLLYKLLEIPEYKEKYHKYLRYIAENILSDATFSGLLVRARNSAAAYAESPNRLYDDDSEDMIYLQEFALARAQSILSQLDGETPSVSEGFYDMKPPAPKIKTQTEAGKFMKSLKKLSDGLLSDFRGVTEAFSRNDTEIENLDEQVFGEDIDIVKRKVNNDKVIFRTHILTVSILTATLILICISISKRRV